MYWVPVYLVPVYWVSLSLDSRFSFRGFVQAGGEGGGQGEGHGNAEDTDDGGHHEHACVVQHVIDGRYLGRKRSVVVVRGSP